MSQFYHDGSRALQDAFHSRPIADRTAYECSHLREAVDRARVRRNPWRAICDR
jgi:hypothetical protein